MRQRPIALRQLVLLAIYGVFALIWLVNPLFHTGTHLTADISPTIVTDYYHFHWNYWWIRHALTHGLDVYFTNYVFAPATSNLGLHTLTPLWYPVWAAFEPAYGTAAAMAAVFFAALLLNGYVFHGFFEGQGASPGMALVGGLLMQGSAQMYDSLQWTTVNLMGWFWLPLVILVWLRIVERPSKAWGWVLALGAALWAMILTDLQYVIFLAFVFLPVGVWTLVRFVRTGHLSRIAPTLLAACAALMIALGLLWVGGTLHAVLTFDRSVLATTPPERAPNLNFPEGYIQRQDGISLGALVLPLFLLSCVLYERSRRVRWSSSERGGRYEVPPNLWLLLSIPVLVLSAGDSIDILGATVTLPYVWLHAALGGTFRYPERFASVFMMCALAFSLPVLSSVLARIPLAPLKAWGRRYIVPACLILLALWDIRIFQSVPLQPLPTAYDFYQQMGQEPYDYVVLEVPTAGASGEGIVGRSEWAATQFYGIVHGKRMVNGHLSRVDPWRYLYMETADPMMAWLGQRRYLEPDIVREQLAERISSFPIGYLVVHTQWLPQNGPTLQEVLGFLNAQSDLLCPQWIEGEAIVYRTAWHPEPCAPRAPRETEVGVYEIDIGSPEDQRFIGWGWHWREDIGPTLWRWMGDYPRLGGEIVPPDGFLHSDLYVELPAGDYEMVVYGQAFAVPRQLTVSVNGDDIGAARVLPDALQALRFPIRSQGRQLMQIRLAYDSYAIPADLGQGTDTRRLVIAVDTIRFVRR